MTQIFDDKGIVHPVTVLKAGPMVVTAIKTIATDGYNAIQVGFGEKAEKNINKPEKGHMGSGNFRYLKEFEVEGESVFAVGDTIDLSTFSAGDVVTVSSISKGKGFQGVVKRHGFSGSPATHGHKDQLRMPGSIGATGPQRVFKGMRMGGHMGDAQITVKNLEIVKVEAENDTLYIKGALPGARNGLILIKTMTEDAVFEPEFNVLEKEEIVADVVEEKTENVVESEEKNSESVSDEAVGEVVAEEKTEEENKEDNK